MNMRAIFDQFSNSSTPDNSGGNNITDTLGKLGSQLPGGLAGGAVAGGLMSLLLSNKSARKFAGTAATYGGVALLGGLAYKAYNNWQSGQQNHLPIPENSFTSSEILSADYQLTLIKAMIAAAQVDGHIDAGEQQKIFGSIEKMNLSVEMKAVVFDLIRHPVSIQELVNGAQSLEQKTELYLVSNMIIDPEKPAEKTYLARLANALGLAPELATELQVQAKQNEKELFA